MSSINNDLTEWRNLLQQATAPLENKTAHQYITDTADHQHKITAKPTGTEHKLSIREVVTESAQLIATEKSRGDIVRVKTDIADLTNQLIQAKVDKREHSYLRRLALVLCVVSSAVLIGIPFLILLRNGDRKFYGEIAQLKAMLNANEIPDVLSLTRTVAVRLEESGFGLQQQQELFETAVNKSYGATRTQEGIVGLFEADTKRGYQLQFNDHEGEINNTVHPSPALSESGRVQAVVEALHQINNSDWEIAIQCACNQTALMGSIDPFVMLFNQGAIQENVRWTEGETTYSPQFTFQQESSPFVLTINRNEHTHEIESIEFAVEKNLDIEIHNSSDNSHSPGMKNALTARTTYSLTLDEQRRPRVHNLQTTMNLNIGNAELD